MAKNIFTVFVFCMISFTANLLNRPKIRMYNNDTFSETKAAFLELNPMDAGDNKALERLISHWGREDSYVRIIEDNFKNNKYHPEINTTERFFVLAEPKRDGQFLDVKKILAVAQTSAQNPKNGVEIDYFQVMPKYIERQTNYGRRDVGKAMMDSLKKIFSGKNIWLYSTNSARDFYLKNGFKQTGVSVVGLPIMKFFGK